MTLAPSADCAADGAICTEGGLALSAGIEASVPAHVAPYVSAVSIVADATGDGVWSDGELMEVRIEFNEPVTVSGSHLTVDVLAEQFRLPVSLGYKSGSGSTGLLFSERIPPGSTDFTRLCASSRTASSSTAGPGSCRRRPVSQQTSRTRAPIRVRSLQHE